MHYGIDQIILDGDIQNTTNSLCSVVGIEIIILCQQPPTHVMCCWAVTTYVAILQRIFTQFTNGWIYVVVDPYNATKGNTYLFIGVDLSNTYMGIGQRIHALLKGVPVVVQVTENFSTLYKCFLTKFHSPKALHSQATATEKS